MKSFTFIVPNQADQHTFSRMMGAIGISVHEVGPYIRVSVCDGDTYCEEGDCTDKNTIVRYETVTRYLLEIGKDATNFWEKIFPRENP